LDKYDAVIRKAETNWSDMKPNEKFDFNKVCNEHSSRGAEARRIRDNK
jgi:hypothetical protein